MFKGYIAAVVTPFKNGEVDVSAFENYISWLVDSGVSGIVVCGSTGESLTLTREEQKELICTANKVVAGRVKLIGGVIASSTEKCLALIRNSEQYVDGFLCICPFYVKPTQDQLILHFSRLNEITSKPIILYNNPSRVGVSICKKAFDIITKLEHVVAIKECACDLSRFALWRMDVDKDFDFLTGNDDSAFGALAMGAKGVVSVTANVCPKLCVEAYNAFMKGDREVFEQCRDKLAVITSLMFAEPSPAPAKYVLSRLGIMSEEVRAPLTPITLELKSKIDEIIGDFR